MKTEWKKEDFLSYDDKSATFLATLRDLSLVFWDMGIFLKVLMFRRMRTRSGAITVLVTGWKILKGKKMYKLLKIFRSRLPGIKQLNARMNGCPLIRHQQVKWRWAWGCWGGLRGRGQGRHSGTRGSGGQSWRCGNYNCEPNTLPKIKRIKPGLRVIRYGKW